jgi:hypothetical protein
MTDALRANHRTGADRTRDDLLDEIDRLREQLAEVARNIASRREALKVADAAINPPDRGGISLDEWNKRLKAATATIRAALGRPDGS